MSINQERYHEYLKSGEWKLKRSQKLKQANFRCDGCGEKAGAMEVHHLTYDRVGMELLTDLAAYCIDCHKVAHNKVAKSDWSLYLSFNTDNKPTEKSKEDLKWEAFARVKD